MEEGRGKQRDEENRERRGERRDRGGRKRERRGRDTRDKDRGSKRLERTHRHPQNVRSICEMQLQFLAYKPFFVFIFLLLCFFRYETISSLFFP